MRELVSKLVVLEDSCKQELSSTPFQFSRCSHAVALDSNVGISSDLVFRLDYPMDVAELKKHRVLRGLVADDMKSLRQYHLDEFSITLAIDSDH